MIFNLCLLTIILANKSKFIITGTLFRFYILAYCSFRFFIEFLRADTGLPIFSGLKVIQINLFLVILYFSWWLFINIKTQSNNRQT